MAQRFVPIVIKSLEELNALYSAIATHAKGLVEIHSELQAVRKAVDLTTPKNQLKRWLDDLGIDVCPVGEQKILAAAGKVNSWREYFAKHWNDVDGAQGWFFNNAWELVGRNLESCTRDCDDFPTLEACLRYNRKQGHGPVEWASWPFKKVSRRKKGRKK